ncbi:MAG: hypothetical protein BGO31_14905 [Bacteroidetes bacterium 43-16]|nr:MAG: hypothetical protein BGO31_14905 [Bacteroidetes bacterium 43-16]
MTILISIIYLLATTSFQELLKLPLLVEHYIEYDGGFVDFVVHHYGGHEKDEDWETDQKLPFMQLSPVLAAVCDLPSRHEIVLHQLIEDYTDQPITVWHEDNLIQNYLDRIFQPPRHC